jgi:hypothetical protein
VEPSRLGRRWEVSLALAALGLFMAQPAPATARLTPRHDAGGHRGLISQEPSVRSLRKLRAHAAIVGGKPAEKGTLPWLAWVADFRGEGLGVCTGTVVASNLILTAGHCAEDVETGAVNEPGGYRVVTGNVNWAAPSTEKQVSLVSRVIVYPYYERSGPLEGWGDAALLVLAAPISSPPVPLATNADAELWQPGGAAVIAGWGRTYYEQGTLTELLQWAVTGVQGPEWCKNNAPGLHPVGQLCAINPPEYEVGTCEGDSGGPLLALRPGTHEFVEIGITSGGYGHCSTTAPDVFTRASLVSQWVRAWAEALKPPPPPATPQPPVTAAAASTSAPPPPAAPPPSAEGVYRGSTSQGAALGIVAGAGGSRVTAIATRLTYRCRSGHSLTEPLEGLSNREYESITPSHTFSIGFARAYENQAIAGTIDPARGDVSGILRGTWRTRRYGLCSTGAISWSAHRPVAAASTSRVAAAGRYKGWTNQEGHIGLTVAGDGKELAGLTFSATYVCPRHHSVRMTESFLSAADTEKIERLGTFSVYLGGLGFSGRVDGAFGVSGVNAFGTLEASAVTRYGKCRTGLVPWSAPHS